MSKRALITLIIVYVLVPEFRSSTDANKNLQTRSDSVERQSGPIDYFSVNDSRPSNSNYIDVTNPGHNLSAVINDGGTDNTAALQAIIDFVSGQGKILYFPPGRYYIASDVIIKPRTRLFGSRYGISMIEADASKAQNIKIGNTMRNNDGQIHVDYLFFDGVNLHFGHESHSTHFIFVSHCVFFSKNRPGQGAKTKSTVRFVNITNSPAPDDALGYSVFLRDKHAFGVASNFVHSFGIKVRNNIFGLDLGRIDWLETELSDLYWKTLKLKLNFLNRTFQLQNDQGYFKCSIYNGFCNHSLIEKNIFNGSPNSESYHHDHVAYLKGFDGMKFLQNYARGWPSDASGGIKARNGKELVIARNYIDDTGIILYSHMQAKPEKLKYLYLGLKDVVVYGNHVVQRTNTGHRTTGISYFEPHKIRNKPETDGKDENLRYSANVFEIVEPSNSTLTEECIFLTNGNQSEHYIYSDNVYYGTTQRVRLECRHCTPSYESGNISSALIAPYVNMTLPDYNIPVYE